MSALNPTVGLKKSANKSKIYSLETQVLAMSGITVFLDILQKLLDERPRLCH